MKKLMIAVAIVCAAAMSQAAQLTWSSYAMSNAAGDPLASGMAYLVMVDNAGTFAVGNDLTITGGHVVDSVEIGNGMIPGAWQDTGSLVNGTDYLFAIIGTTAGEAGKTLPTTGLYGVDYDGDGAAAGAGKFYTATWNSDTGAALAINWNNYDAGAFVTSPVGAVPEPTSGLLLILGVAGLALRRRRA